MQKIQYRVPAIICTLVCVFATVDVSVKSIDIASAVNVHSRKSKLHQQSGPVAEWFAKYDQIRRDAEMTNGDKLQSILLTAKIPQKNNAALAARMIKKYTIALSEMNKLRSIPETRELQQGYTAYFSTARQLFSEYLKAQSVVPFTNRSLIPHKKKLEALDKTNKKLDAKLRKQYIIAKHKHH